jgi:putative tryptophan/tyrosine transport system substrate-binding protein
MRRREFIGALGGAAAWPRVVTAQQSAVPVIGYVSLGSTKGFATRLAAFRQGLQETGYREGENVVIEYRWADGRTERLPALAADLVAHRVAVIITPGSVAATLAAKAATKTIPIVFETGADPIVSGFVASLRRPEGNVTGVTSLNFEVAPKRLELLRELLPGATSVAVLVNPSNPNAETVPRDLRGTAAALGLDLNVAHASSEGELETIFSVLGRQRSGGLVVSPDPFFINRSELLGALTVRHGVVSIFHSREFVVAGGLVSYGGSVADTHRIAGVYTGRVLKGEKPADLPVQQSVKVELTMNLNTAKTLDLTIPPTLLARANEVIE